MKKIEAKRAPGANPDTAFEPEQINAFSRKLSVWKINDSEVGPGEIKASVEANAVDQLIDLTLKWTSGDDQPEVWAIEWSHYPGYLLRELPEYLRRFCPVANEMIEVLGRLGLEDFPTIEKWDQLNEELPPYGNN